MKKLITILSALLIFVSTCHAEVIFEEETIDVTTYIADNQSDNIEYVDSNGDGKDDFRKLKNGIYEVNK